MKHPNFAIQSVRRIRSKFNRSSFKKASGPDQGLSIGQSLTTGRFGKFSKILRSWISTPSPPIGSRWGFLPAAIEAPLDPRFRPMFGPPRDQGVRLPWGLRPHSAFSTVAMRSSADSSNAPHNRRPFEIAFGNYRQRSGMANASPTGIADVERSV